MLMTHQSGNFRVGCYAIEIITGCKIRYEPIGDGGDGLLMTAMRLLSNETTKYDANSHSTN